MITNQQKTVLEKESIPKVDLNFMNNTHFEEIEMVKELGEHITDFQDNKTTSKADGITKILSAWLEHTDAHFARENALMEEIQFPALPIHMQEHERSLTQLKMVLETWINEQDIEQLSDYIFELWPAWFNAHVNSMDMMTARFAVMNGYKETN